MFAGREGQVVVPEGPVEVARRGSAREHAPRRRHSPDRRAGRTLSLPDLLIAASAIHHGLVLLADNVKDFLMRDLRLGRLEE